MGHKARLRLVESCGTGRGTPVGTPFLVPHAAVFDKSSSAPSKPLSGPNSLPRPRIALGDPAARSCRFLRAEMPSGHPLLPLSWQWHLVGAYIFSTLSPEVGSSSGLSLGSEAHGTASQGSSRKWRAYGLRSQCRDVLRSVDSNAVGCTIGLRPFKV